MVVNCVDNTTTHVFVYELPLMDSPGSSEREPRTAVEPVLDSYPGELVLISTREKITC